MMRLCDALVSIPMTRNHVAAAATCLFASQTKK